MGFSKKDFEFNKKAFRRTWDIDPVQKAVPLKTRKIRDKKVDWRTELEEAEEENNYVFDGAEDSNSNSDGEGNE